MSIRAKLDSLAEGALDSLKTTEVQLPLFGVLWACLAAWFPAVIPLSIDITPLTSLIPAGFGTALPSAITPGWLIICLPLLFFAKLLTPGRVPFQSGNTPITKLDVERTVAKIDADVEVGAALAEATTPKEDK